MQVAKIPELSALCAICLLAISTNAAGDRAELDASPAAIITSPSKDSIPTPLVGNIYFKINDVFDVTNPKENKWLFRLVNSLHVNTKDFVIKKQLLFKSGDPFSMQLLQETERLLRANPYLYDAQIRPIRSVGNRIDVQVNTRDVWTFTGGINYSRSGGESRSSFELEEKNLFGLGKTLKIRRSIEQNRTGNLFEYLDPAVGSNRLRLNLNFTDNSDGTSSIFDLTRPFYSLDSRWTFGSKILYFERDERLYDNGEITNTFKQTEDELQIFGGMSEGIKRNKVKRWRYGYRYLRNRFSETSNTTNTATIPENRILSYPWVELTGFENRFTKTRRIDHISRTEDLNLGKQFNVSIGIAQRRLGSSKNQLIVESDISKKFRLWKSDILFLTFSGDGRLSTDKSENVLLQSRARFFSPMHRHQTLYTDFQFSAGYNLDRENQLLLGGDNGLRGYPSNYLSGNRKILINMESRFYSDAHLWQLLHFGALIFFDAGYAWQTGESDFSDVAKDIGIGIRIASSRSGRGKMLHLDLAFPLDGNENIKRRQFLVSTHSRF